MRSRFPALVAVAILVALSLPAIAGARSAPSAADAERAATLAYWTAERVANAKPKDLVKTVVGYAQAPKPNAKPGGGSGAVKGASWVGTSHDTIRVRSGRVLFHQGNGDWICSGSVVTDGTTSTGYSTILTAGHCVYDGADGWATRWIFMPDFDEGPVYNDCANTEFGCWTATRLAANATFFSEGGFGTERSVEVDYGFARVGLGGPNANSTTDLDSLGGAYPLKTSATGLTVQQWAFGYPAAGRYHGKDLVYCTNGGGTSLINDPNGADTWGMACNMTGGSSGGPWITGGTDPSVATGWSASSVNSYGYSGLTYMFGPKFNSATTTVLGDVADGSATGGTSVIFNISTP
jgi:V8-like Glu-specific endopeptidase